MTGAEGTSGVLAGALAVARREARSMLTTPLGWCVLAAFTALAGAVFALAVFRSGAPATLRAVYIAMGWAVLATAPAISMRSIAEERRHGTWASLAAAPGGTWAAVVGKMGAAKIFLLLCIALPAAAQLLALELWARPDYGEAFTALLGLLLAGSAYMASGMLMSALTGSQVGAYLLTLFLWLVWMVVARSAPEVLPANAAYIAFALDPLRRLDDFLLGVLDTANVVFFAVIGAWFMCVTALVVQRPLLSAQRSGLMRLAAAVAFSAALAVGVVGIASAPAARAAFDMTKTRSYTLSPETASLLASLQGDWTVAVIRDTSVADPAVVRQIDEVLARMESAGGGRMRTLRVDPNDPSDAARYEGVLESVQARDAKAMQAHAAAIAAGIAAFDRLTGAAAVQQASLTQVVSSLAADSPDRTELDSLRAAFAQLVAQKPAFDKSLRELRTATDTRPFPDEARAAAALAANVAYWSEQLQATSRSLSQRQRDRINEPALATWIEEAVPLYISLARELRTAQDSLEQLPKLFGSEVGAELAKGDAAVVIGPPGIAVIPGAQLVAGAAGGGAVAFDRRFRGEQLVAAAIRSLGAEAPPVAVFMHAGVPGMLRARPDHADFSSMADALRSKRIDAMEWIPGESPEPLPPRGRKLVWVIVPPIDRDGVRDNPRERTLLAAAQKLIARGEPVLLSVGPSLASVMGQRDPWIDLLQTRGVRPETGQSILEVVPVGPARAQTIMEQSLRDFDSRTSIGSAVDGQLARFDRAVPVTWSPNSGAAAVAEVAPSSARWIETDWRREQHARLSAPADKQVQQPVPVVVAAQSQGAAPVRTVVVGSPLWLHSAIADVADPLGGGRVALRYPGNRELLVNAVAWLAGREDLVASAGSGREVDRLPTLSSATRVTVGVTEAAVLPAAIAAAGAVIVLRRRWRT